MAAKENLNDPHFVVVGHPNKGKSTIVSTLACDSSVEVDATPGTTQTCQSYPMRLGERVLYTLVDTPGFQRPRRVLEYLKSEIPPLPGRISRFAELLNDPNSGKLFPEEIEILSSIMYPDAGIIYVVDGSVPYSIEYEPEMEILQWSGKPRMALINPILGEHFITEWERALRHFFGIVKIFNPVTSQFNVKIDLLRAFEHLDSSWSSALRSAQSALLANRVIQEEQTASAIAEALIAARHIQVSTPISTNLEEGALQEKLTLLIKTELNKIENLCWKSIDEIFHHTRLSILKQDMSVLEHALFSKESIRLFGLTKAQISIMGLASGGTVGALLDMTIGGTSLLAGSALGAGLGAISATLGANRLLKFRRLRLPICSVPIGSHKMVARLSDNLNIAFILLSRAITYYSIISERAHGNRSSIHYEHIKPPTFDIAKLNTLRRLLRNSRTGVINEKAGTEIAGIILELIRCIQSNQMMDKAGN